VDVVVKAAAPPDCLRTRSPRTAYLLGTPANLGYYISGALKALHERESTTPVSRRTMRRPFGVYLHGNSDTTGASGRSPGRSPPRGTSAAKPSTVIDRPTQADLGRMLDLGASLARA